MTCCSQVHENIQFLYKGKLYSGNDGSVKDKYGAYTYSFTSINTKGAMGEGVALTPGVSDEMFSLDADHGGALEILLVLYAVQNCLGPVTRIQHGVSIRIDNADVLSMENKSLIWINLKNHMGLDYDL